MRPCLIGIVTSFPWRYCCCCCCCCSAQVILPEKTGMADIPSLLNSRWISTSLCKRYLALQVRLICRHFRRKRQFSPFLFLRILRDLLLSLSLSLEFGVWSWAVVPVAMQRRYRSCGEFLTSILLSLFSQLNSTYLVIFILFFYLKFPIILLLILL